MADAFNNLPQPVQDFIVAIGGLTAAFGILLPAILAVSYLFGPMMLINSRRYCGN